MIYWDSVSPFSRCPILFWWLHVCYRVLSCKLRTWNTGDKNFVQKRYVRLGGMGRCFTLKCYGGVTIYVQYSKRRKFLSGRLKNYWKRQNPNKIISGPIVHFLKISVIPIDKKQTNIRNIPNIQNIPVPGYHTVWLVPKFIPGAKKYFKLNGKNHESKVQVWFIQLL